MNGKKILFIIFNNEVKLLEDNGMDHREWYLSLGGSPENYDNLIRGFVVYEKIIFFKGNFAYDEEVISCAKTYAPYIRTILGNNNLEVCCGILANGQHNEWEPILVLKDEDLGIKPETIKEKIDVKKESDEISSTPQRTIIDFKNKYNDPRFIKIATIVSIITLIIAIVFKILFIKKITSLEFFTTVTQLILFIITIIGYKQEKEYVRYTSLLCSLSLVLMFNIPNIILGILYFIFSVDMAYYTKIINIIKRKK